MSARRVVITGIGCVSAAGAGVGAFATALASHRSRPGPSPDAGYARTTERVETIHGRTRDMTLARVAVFDHEQHLPARKLRRMGDLSKVWVISSMLAGADAGLLPENPYAPERRGTYLGTGFGCTQTTWEYLAGMMRDGAGMANPFQFSESVANAPAGHSAIELDTRAASVTLTCGDASAAAALSLAGRAIRDGRADVAWCGGVEMFSQPMLRVLSTVGASSFLGEGSACFVLEAMEPARARGARVYAELAGWASAADPAAGATEWTREAMVLASSLRAAHRQAGARRGEPVVARSIYLHAPGALEADDAERRAADQVCPEAERLETTSLTGSLSAAGGFNIAAAALDLSAAARRDGAGCALVNASSWGGTVFTLALRPVAA